ncbi:MAG: sugar transferase [Pseudomonadota bacterium]|nr:sugar transferase [Pseudomonadota bacterium]
MALTTAIQNQGWFTGRPDGIPWTLSRTKRVVDALIALLLLSALLPALVAIALLIKLTSRGPVFFIQRRTGYRGRRFGMFKFRTMVADAEALKASLRHLNKHGAGSVDFKIDDDPRITPVGRILRKTSLDELPNLINVVRGDMRLVGPRPTSFNANTYEKSEYLRRLGVYPGVTGLWQISGRSDIGFAERVELDVRYIHNQGPLQDLKILVMTPIKILTGEGAS